MKNEDIIKILIGIGIGLFVAYFFLWGQTYSGLKQENAQLREDYIELNESYDNLQKECGKVLQAYKACVGREDFFTWVDRFFALKNLAKLLGLLI